MLVPGFLHQWGRAREGQKPAVPIKRLCSIDVTTLGGAAGVCVAEDAGAGWLCL